MALAGALALLVGVSARRRVRRLKRDGIKVWAEAVHRPLPSGALADTLPDGDLRDGEQQVTLRYTLTDGRMMERTASTVGRAAGTGPEGAHLVRPRATRRKSSSTAATAALRTWRSSPSA